MKSAKYIVGVFTLALFIVMFYFYMIKEELWTDRMFSIWFEGNVILGFFSFFADPPTVIVVSLLLLIYLWVFKKNYRGMLFALFAIGGGTVVNVLLKNWINRERPELEDQLLTFSFPSGHAMTGLIYLFTVAYFLTEDLFDRKKQAIIWSAALLLAILIGLSRVANIHHYGSDVVAGWAIGYSWFALVMWWYEYRKRQFTKHKTSSA